MIHVSTTWKQHMCFIHAHHENTSSIKINFKSLTVSLFHHTRKLPLFFQQLSKWKWNKLTMHLKRYNIPKMFFGWIISNNLFTWLAENICRDSSFCLLSLQQHTCNELLTWMIFVFNLSGFFEFVHTNRRSQRDLFLRNIKLLLDLEF